MVPTGAGNDGQGMRPRLTPRGIGLDQFLRTLRRRRALFLGSIVLLAVASGLAILQITPRYTAQATVMVDPREQRIVEIETVVSKLVADTQAIQSEIQVIRSHDLARRVVASTGIAGVAEFNPALGQSFAAALLERLDWPWLRTAFGQILADAAAAARHQDELVVENFLRRLDASALNNSRVIGIEFTARDPELAARVANAVADAYVELQLQKKLAATRQASSWLEERLDELRAELAASEQAVEEFRAAQVSRDGWDPALTAQQLSETSSELTKARAEHETARARLTRIEQLVGQHGPVAVFDVVGTNTLLLMNEQLVRLQQTEADVTARYGEDHEVAAALRRRIEGLHEQTAHRLIAAARNDVEVAESKVGAFEAALRQLLEDRARLSPAQITLRTMEREAEATSALFETLLNRSKETAQVGLEQPDAWIVSRARPPARPSFPNTLLLLTMAFGGSVLLGAGVVFAAEELEPGYRTLDHLTRELGLRALGQVPYIRDPRWRIDPAGLVLHEVGGRYAESLRTVLVGVMQSGEGEGARVVLFTSSAPREGKTVTVASLARLAARAGHRVLALDCDLRHPGLDVTLGLERGPGLSESLRDGAGAAPPTRQDAPSGAAVISAGEPSEDSLALLQSPRFAALLGELRPHYDLILIDSPPVLAVADPRVLAALADQCVLVVKWRETRRDSVAFCQTELLDAGARLAGAVLTQVRADQSEAGDYYDDYYRSERDSGSRRSGRAA